MLKQVINSQEITAAKKLFDECRNVVIIAHQSPDGDAIGSSLGMAEFLKRKGKKVNVIMPNYFPDFLKWMKGADEIIIYERQHALSNNVINMADLMVCLDFNVPSRTAEMEQVILNAHCKKILIDHHLNPAKFTNVTISRPSASSASELVFRLIDSMGELKNLTHAGAEAIYAGMNTDTGSFTFNSNDPEIFMIIAELLKKGIDKDVIYRRLYHTYSADRLRLQGYILYNKLKIYEGMHASVFGLTKDELSQFHFLKGDMEGVVNMPLQIKGHKMSISLREDTEKPVIWVSLRSVDDFSVEEVAKRFFNGGGHFNAAGGRLENMTMEEAMKVADAAVEAFADKLK